MLGDNWVLTAAHCAERKEPTEVILGAINYHNNEPDQVRIDVREENIFVHQNWSAATVANDIALIRLPSSVALSSKFSGGMHL